jgi:hypothetical protein
MARPWQVQQGALFYASPSGPSVAAALMMWMLIIDHGRY